MESPFIPRIATGFGAGVGGQGSLCGALTGGLMAIGLRYGRSSAQDVECKESAYTLAQEFYRRFEAQMGSVLCREITGCDLTTPEGRVRFKVTDQHNRCADHVGKAAHILGELLVEDMSDERSTV